MNSTSTALSPKVIFAEGSLSRIRDEILQLNKERVLLICDESASKSADFIMSELGSLVVNFVDHVVAHVPDSFSEPIVKSAVDANVDLVITIGGGSATGLGKIIALDCGVDLVAIPTTYAGSEMTSIWGRTANAKKITGRDFRALPTMTIYDPNLSSSLPLEISVNSGMNAIAHAAEALYAPDLTSEVKDAALEGIAVVASGIKGIVADLTNTKSRADLLRGSMLCGFSLNNATMGIHHKICHTLGGMFELAHAPMHSAVLPHAIYYNQNFASDQLNEMAQVLGASTAAQGVWDLAKEVGAQTSLKSIGYPFEKSEEVAEVISSATYKNPRPFDFQGIVELLKNSYQGSRPDDES